MFLLNLADFFFFLFIKALGCTSPELAHRSHLIRGEENETKRIVSGWGSILASPPRGLIFPLITQSYLTGKTVFLRKKTEKRKINAFEEVNSKNPFPLIKQKEDKARGASAVWSQTSVPPRLPVSAGVSGFLLLLSLLLRFGIIFHSDIFPWLNKTHGRFMC